MNKIKIKKKRKSNFPGDLTQGFANLEKHSTTEILPLENLFRKTSSSRWLTEPIHFVFLSFKNTTEKNASININPYIG
jgi:hypothetical protein